MTYNQRRGIHRGVAEAIQAFVHFENEDEE